MTDKDLAERLTSLLEPLAATHGAELVAVEQLGGRHTPIIRVLLDCEGGMNIDAICEANAWISEAIDEVDPISAPYMLEVSSPGIDRPLRTREHYRRFAGETVTVKTRAQGHNRSHWTGTLVGLEGDDVVLDVEGERVVVPFDSVQKARLKGVVSFTSEGGAS